MMRTSFWRFLEDSGRPLGLLSHRWTERGHTVLIGEGWHLVGRGYAPPCIPYDMGGKGRNIWGGGMLEKVRGAGRSGCI